jgi:hypothetical protein
MIDLEQQAILFASCKKFNAYMIESISTFSALKSEKLYSHSQEVLQSD